MLCVKFLYIRNVTCYNDTIKGKERSGEDLGTDQKAESRRLLHDKALYPDVFCFALLKGDYYG